MQKNFVLYITNLAIMAAVAIITNLGFICMTLGAVCGKAKTYTSLIVLICISSSLSPRCRFIIAPSCHCAIVRKCVRIRIGLKLILGLAINTAGILDGYYVDALWVNIVTLAAVNFELSGSVTSA